MPIGILGCTSVMSSTGLQDSQKRNPHPVAKDPAKDYQAEQIVSAAGKHRNLTCKSREPQLADVSRSNLRIASATLQVGHAQMSIQWVIHTKKAHGQVLLKGVRDA